MDVDALIAQLAREATELLPGNTPVRLAGQPATDATPRPGPHFLVELARAFEELPDLFATARGLAYLQGQEETDGGSEPMPDDQDEALREWWRAEHAKLVLLAETPGVGSDVVAARAQRLVEREASTQLSAARTDGVTLAARRLGWVLVLVPERDACLVCTSYAGSVVEPGGLFAAVRDFTAGTLAEDGVSVPVHSWCRCDVRAVAPEDADSVADPLHREAERSVLRFDALPSESDRARTEAAKRLIDSGTRLAKTVIQRSAVAIRRRDKAAAKVVADRVKARAKAAKARARERARLRKKRAPLLKRKRALEQELRRLRRK